MVHTLQPLPVNLYFVGVVGRTLPTRLPITHLIANATYLAAVPFTSAWASLVRRTPCADAALVARSRLPYRPAPRDGL